MIFVGEKEPDGKEPCHGIATVLLRKGTEHPFFKQTPRYSLCSFSGIVQSVETDERLPNGKPVYASVIYKFSAFGKMAFICRDLNQSERFVFYGYREIDQYWTERSETGEVAYNITITYIDRAKRSAQKKNADKEDEYIDPSETWTDGGELPY